MKNEIALSHSLNLATLSSVVTPVKVGTYVSVIVDKIFSPIFLILARVSSFALESLELTNLKACESSLKSVESFKASWFVNNLKYNSMSYLASSYSLTNDGT